MSVLSFIFSLLRDASSSRSISPPLIPTPNYVAIDPAPTDPEWLILCRPITQHFESCYLIAYCDPASAMAEALQKDGLWYKYLANREIGDSPKYSKLDGKPWTCGWGDTVEVVKSTIFTQAEADSRLTTRLLEKGAAVDRLVTVQLLPREKASITDFTYNEGEGRLATSTMLKRLNDSNFGEAMIEMKDWNKAGGKVSPGLVTRRQADIDLFTTGVWIS